MISNKKWQLNLQRLLIIIVITLFVNLPVVTALQISNVNAEVVNPSEVAVTWTTDEASTSFVNYGMNQQSLQKVGDGLAVTQHRIRLANLNPTTTYYYGVESSNVVDNNEGNYYSFTTPEPDTVAPGLAVTIPPQIAGNQFNLIGYTELGATVQLFVNNALVQSTTAVALLDSDETSAEGLDGRFEFQNIFITADTVSTIKVAAQDASGNVVAVEGTVYADSSKPLITLGPLPTLTTETRLMLNGTISENSTVQILVNNRSQGEFIDVLAFEQELDLEEGANTVLVTAIDGAGWQDAKEISINSDTEPPRVKFELTRGTEYYENRADTDLTGETEPGATVYLFVYAPRQEDYQADFKRALKKTTADSTGKFEFKEISFPPPALTNWIDLMPQEVPAGLEESILSYDAEDQQKTFYVYIIAKDQTGQSGYEREIVHVNTCYSGSFAFDIYPTPEFPPQPFRLDPQLIKEGRETIGAVFNVDYQGSGVVEGEELPYKIYSVDFEPACTRDTVKDSEYRYGCQLVRDFDEHPNPDKTVYYITADLRSTEDYLDNDEFWGELTNFSKRQLKFPLKILVYYSEREPDGSWGERQTQAFCYDLGYFVDVPIDSSEYVPDFLADEGVAALNWTINLIEDFKPILTTAMWVTGISCGASILVKLVTKIARFFTERFEYLTDLSMGDSEEKCKSPSDQSKYFYLDSTINYYESELRGRPGNGLLATSDLNSLDKACPGTAGIWELEAKLDWLYKLTCDRFFCREVPAGWTEDAEYTDVNTINYQQDTCSATSRCSALGTIENCQDKHELGPLASPVALQETFTCYNYNGEDYVILNSNQDDDRDQVVVLTPINNLCDTLPCPDRLLAYQPDENSGLCVAIDQGCNSRCRDIGNYQAVTDGYTVSETGFATSSGPCYKENYDSSSITLTNSKNDRMQPGSVTGGFTRDCFIADVSEEMYQCVCEPEDAETPITGRLPTDDDTARMALVGDGEFSERYIYRQDIIFKDTGGNTKTCQGGEAGTCYPSWRYYSGRDQTAAFGLNYAFDNFREFEPGGVNTMTSTTVDPKDYWGAWQTLCIPKMYKQLNALQGVLLALRNCILEAKYTQSWDAGMCKTFFTQQVCGLIYRGLSAVFNDCSPRDYDTTTVDEDISDIEAGFDAMRSAIPQAIEATTSEVSSDYGAEAQNFVETGFGGMAQSMCLAFFGIDTPIFDLNLIMETAYATPMKTAIYFPIASREMTTFNPAEGTATFNYNLGGFMVPGCKFRGYKVTLKCIGPEDLGHPGIDESCSGQGCDCLQITDETAIMSQREYPVKSDFGTISPVDFFSFPIDSPQRVSSVYRYDHVVVELYLDSANDPENCFDEGYYQDRTATYYFPITHVGGPEQVEQLYGGPQGCQVHVPTGRFICPSLQALFGGGQTYFEPPGVRCYDTRNDEYVDCNTPNLFLEDDDIIVKTYLNLGEDEACLKVSDNLGLVEVAPLKVGGSLLGPDARILTLGTVDDNMLSGGRLVTLLPDGNQGSCGIEVDNRPEFEDFTGGQTISFTYSSAVDNKYTLQVPDAVTIISGPGYSRGSNKELTLSGTAALTLDEINVAQFSWEEFTFHLDLDNLGSQSGTCTYRANRGTSYTETNTRNFIVTFELLQPGAGGNCWNTDTPLPETTAGSVRERVTIRVQRQATEVAQASDIYDDFIAEEYDRVISQASDIVLRKESTLDDAVAIYYWIASLIEENDGINDQSKEDLKRLLNLFFDRRYQQEQLAAYPGGVTETGEYQRIQRYLCETAAALNEISGDCDPDGSNADTCYNVPRACNPEETGSSTAGTNSQTLCGQTSGLRTGFSIPTNWAEYSCQTESPSLTCYSYTAYVPDNLQTQWRTYGCESNLKCCD